MNETTKWLSNLSTSAFIRIKWKWMHSILWFRQNSDETMKINYHQHFYMKQTTEMVIGGLIYCFVNLWKAAKRSAQIDREHTMNACVCVCARSQFALISKIVAHEYWNKRYKYIYVYINIFFVALFCLLSILSEHFNYKQVVVLKQIAFNFIVWHFANWHQRIHAIPKTKT